ncbi:hypothetical protein OEZ85_000079 [Tetradesmus obliquus]|uniref:Glycoside hydrolase family 38 central domain-containing protein n=1 Tax=Tetradesmus obliquus TaxID=3088 RepID=A0ABY8USK0_TETOB|nr:hypothetical protein OEZ85_000079 [Tetradesmus obliquus]
MTLIAWRSNNPGTVISRGAELLALGQLPLLLLLLWVQAAASRSALYNTSGARINGKLNVHIISHTHNDPGWLRSYAQYHRPFELDGRVIGGVEAILETVVSSLVDNPDRTFVYADLAFFVKWWQELHEDTKAVVRQLVQQGRFEFAGGGIVQHDEATSHYSGMVDQMSLGMRFLQQEFGRAPTVAWQLDGFGHSCTEALLKSMGGFQALFIGRSAMADMQQRKSNRSLEFVWRGSESYGAESDIFVSQYPTGNYGPPTMDWFFEQNLQEKPLPAHIDDDPETGSFTVDKAVDLFVQKAQEWQQYMHGDDIYFLMGHDFTHSEARMWFSNIDKLIHYVNKDGRVNALYSTPARYTAAKLSTPGLQLALKTDDFFPYSSSESGDEYWAGFYTSRPTLKTQIRRGWALLRATQQLEVLAQLQPGSSRLATTMGLQYNHPADASETARLGSKLAPDHDPAVLEFALATSLHHDAITGTQRQQGTSATAMREACHRPRGTLSRC